MKIFFLARLELYSFGQSHNIFTSDRNICSLRIHTVISCTSPCTEHIPQFQVINKQYKNVGALHLSENLYQRFKAFVHLLSARMGIFKKSSRWSLQKFDVKCPHLEKGITLFAAQDPHRALLSLCPLLSQLDPHQLLRRGTGQSHPCQLLAGGTSQYISRIFPFNIHLLLDPLGLGPFFILFGIYAAVVSGEACLYLSHQLSWHPANSFLSSLWIISSGQFPKTWKHLKTIVTYFSFQLNENSHLFPFSLEMTSDAILSWHPSPSFAFLLNRIFPRLPSFLSTLSPDAPRAGRAPPLHHLHPHLLLPPRLLLLDVLWGILPISPGHLSLTSKDPFFQVQFPLSLVSIKYKHFLLFGLAAPVANTSLWLAIRLSKEGQDHQDHQVDLVKNANCYLLKFRIVSLRKRRRFWIFWLWSCQCWSSCSGTPSSSSGSSR